MKPTNIIKRLVVRIALIGLGVLMVTRTVQAYETYAGCSSCHGDFRTGSVSLKGTVFPSGSNHEMHRSASSMGTACNLCHSGASRTPVYTSKSNGTTSNVGVGCTGCHVASGLQRHHINNGVTECLECHNPGTPPAENVKPPYYGTADTKVNNPGNPVKVANTNENWSVGDFIGLDNDGNNLYDLADYAVGPYQLLSAKPEGNNVRVTWLTAGGRTNYVQAASSPKGPFNDVSPAIGIPGVGFVTNAFLDLNAANSSTRYYRLRATVP